MGGGVWRAACVALGAAGWCALVVRPDRALHVWWGGVVPVLPALFLVSPRLWRNVCPVAALEVSFGSRSGRTLGGAASIRLGALGVGAFVLLVPARPLLFDRSGGALAAAVLLAALLALARGRTHAVRAGFCNALCPLGPIERLYGQRALLDVEPAHCPTCHACTVRGCPDVAGDKSMRQLLGSGRGLGWLVRPHGALTAAMPGLIVGYASLGPAPTWHGAYGAVLAGGTISWAVVLSVALALPESGRRLPPWLAAISALAFYQLVGPDWARRAGQPLGAGLVRWVGTAVVLSWVARRPRRSERASVRSTTRLVPLTRTRAPAGESRAA